MNNLKRAAVIAVTMMCIASALGGCTTSKNAANTDQAQAAAEMAAREIKQNDYRGGVMRTYHLKDAVLNTIESMKSNNVSLRETNPNSFWDTEGYQDFVVNFLSAPIINDTQWFNEEETTWEDIVNQMGIVESSFTDKSGESYALKGGIEIKRNEKDDYSITNVPVKGLMFTNKEETESDFTGTESYQILYDCDKDWCKAYSLLDLDVENVPDIVPEIYEYARLNNDTFLIQTARERLLVILEPAEQDTDFSQRVVKEFYYSKLVQNGMRTTFKPYQALAEYNEETGEYLEDVSIKNRAIQGYKVINGEGDIATQYGRNESLFLNENIRKFGNKDNGSNADQTDNIRQIGINWVFEDRSLQQAICYRDECLVVKTYNKLTETYERFSYYTKNVTEQQLQELDALINIDGLMGEKKKIPDVVIPQQDIETIMDKKEGKQGGAGDTVESADAEDSSEEKSESKGNDDPDAKEDTESKGETDPVDEAANSMIDEMRKELESANAE